MEKRRPAYPLADIQATLCSEEGLRMSQTARGNVALLGLSEHDVVQIVSKLGRVQFYKSMTSYIDHRVWQDVYRTSFEGMQLYVKFTKLEGEYLLLSLKAL